jgi:hypothetical protein
MWICKRNRRSVPSEMSHVITKMVHEAQLEIRREALLLKTGKVNEEERRRRACPRIYRLADLGHYLVRPLGLSTVSERDENLRTSLEYALANSTDFRREWIISFFGKRGA